jgi:hypothetical protein
MVGRTKRRKTSLQGRSRVVCLHVSEDDCAEDQRTRERNHMRRVSLVQKRSHTKRASKKTWKVLSASLLLSDA